MPNADAIGYYRFALTPDDQARLDAAFARLNSEEQRAYADSLSAAFNAGAIASKAFLAAPPKLAGSSVRQVVTAPLELIDWIDDHLARPEERRVGEESGRTGKS